MLNHTYTSVKNANLVDCGKKQHIPSQPTPLLKENFLGEFRTELDKKKVLAALGIVTELSLEWGNIKGNIGDNSDLIKELDARTKYISSLDNIQKTIGEGISYLETVVGGDKAKDDEQDQFINQLKENLITLNESITSLSEDLSKVTDTDIPNLSSRIDAINTAIDNITNLVSVSSKSDNALQLIEEEGYEGLYVPDLSSRVSKTEQDITNMDNRVGTIEGDLSSFVTKEDLGGDGTYDFVYQKTYDAHIQSVSSEISTIKRDLNNTVKTGEDGHVDTLFVNKISKDTEGNIEVTDSFEVITNKPLDVRFVKDTIEDLLSIPAAVCYEGMGVIVNSLSSLYILKPTEGALTQEYVGDIKNWKCPEDLVTVALTKEDYNNLQEINPNVFYYIYEEEYTLTRPPRREEYDSDQAFEEASIKWKNQVLELDQQYVAASWGIEIEDSLSKKASSEIVNRLQQEINNIKGAGDGPSLDSLGSSISEIKETTQDLEERVSVNELTLTQMGSDFETLSSEIDAVDAKFENYVTKEALQDGSQDFIFVKVSDYESDKSSFESKLSTEISTQKIFSDEVDTNLLTLNSTSVEVNTGRLVVGANEVAFTDDLMKVEVLTQKEYDDKTEDEIRSDTYYYTYEDENPLVTKEELKKATDRISQLETAIMLLTKRVETLES